MLVTFAVAQVWLPKFRNVLQFRITVQGPVVLAAVGSIASPCRSIINLRGDRNKN